MSCTAGVNFQGCISASPEFSVSDRPPTFSMRGFRDFHCSARRSFPAVGMETVTPPPPPTTYFSCILAGTITLGLALSRPRRHRLGRFSRTPPRGGRGCRATRTVWEGRRVSMRSEGGRPWRRLTRCSFYVTGSLRWG